jgi:hypothetical protein
MLKPIRDSGFVRLRLFWACFFVMAPICAPSASAQSRIQQNSFTEIFRSAVPHSGGSAIGIVADGPASDKFGSLYVVLPAHFGGPICVSVTSIDGRYTAQSSYNLGASSGMIVLNFPTQRLDRDVRYQAADLAVSARAGTNCKDQAGKLLVATWSRPGAQGRLGLAVNAGAGTSAFFIEHGVGRHDCDELSVTRSTIDSASISHICWIGAKRLAEGGDIRIFRESPAGRESEIVFPVVAP